MKHAFVFCGPIGSGKSSVSKLFAIRLGVGWNGFGTTVKGIAVERGLSTNRESLQSLGARLVSEERNSLCRRVVAMATDGSGGVAVIDGLRHIDVLEELRIVISPQALACVYVDAPQAVRRERVKTRDGISAEQLRVLEGHSTEIEVEQRLKGVADFIANNTDSIEQCADTIIEWAQSRRFV